MQADIHFMHTTHFIHFLVLVQPRKTHPIVNWNVKNLTKQNFFFYAYGQVAHRADQETIIAQL